MLDALQGHGEAVVSADERYALTRQVTLVGAALDFCLAVAKIIGGTLAHSQALIADGIHSLSDLITDGFVMFAAKHAHTKPDAEHPYGHERIETVATVALGTILILVSIGIAFDSLQRLFDPETLIIPAWWAITIATASVILKESIYHYTMHAARRARSQLLAANAWHSRSDAASSVVVIVGVGGALLGLDYLDALAAVVVAGMIGRVGYRLARQGVAELIDTALEPEQVAAIRAALLEIDGVRDLHMLRTRRMGPKSLVDVHVLLQDPRLSVSEGHHISEAARARLMSKFHDIDDVTIHIDPEDDEKASVGAHLGLRTEIETRLRAAWADIPEAASIRRVTLHYLDEQIEVEVELPLSLAETPDAMASLQLCFQQAVEADPQVNRVRVLFG